MNDNISSPVQNAVRRPRVSFANPLRKYTKLGNDDKAYVNTLMAISLTIVLSLFVLSYYIQEGEKYFVLGSSILMSIIVGASFTIFDRIGVAAPLEEKLSQALHLIQTQSHDYKTIVVSSRIIRLTSPRERNSDWLR